MGAIALILLIQLFRPARTNPPMDVKQDLSVVAHVDPAVQTILDRSCNDCHSSRTIWPWYSKVAPVSWLVASDVNDARRHINFSQWGSYPAYQRQSHLNDICKIVTQRDMPPFTYLLAHNDARLNESERQAICTWTKQAQEETAQQR